MARGREPFTENPSPLVKPASLATGAIPGCVRTRSMGFPLTIGIWDTCSLVIVSLSSPLSVRTAADDASTTTVWETLPSSSCAFTDVITPAGTTTFSIFLTVKPELVTVSVYVPGGTASKRYSPLGPVVAVRVEPSCVLVAVTVAPTVTAAAGSVIMPVIVP